MSRRSDRSRRLIAPLLFLSANLAFAQTPPVKLPEFSAPAEIILRNAKIYTDRTTGRTWSQALSIRDGIIQSLGTNAAIDREKGPNTKVIDLKGKLVLPGFNDGHAMALELGLWRQRLDLTGVNSLAELKGRLTEYANANPNKKWILGFGWDHGLFSDQKPPTKEDLDAIVTNRPVFLWHSSRQVAVLNSKALSRLDPDTASEFVLKNEMGVPAGVLIGPAATEAFQKIDEPPMSEVKQEFLAMQEQAVRYGITSLGGGSFESEDHLKMLSELQKNKELKVRISLWGNLEAPEELLQAGQRYRGAHEEWVRLSCAHAVLDGPVNAHLGAMVEPYQDDPGAKGYLNFTQEKMNELVLKANRLGVPVCLEANGDKAVGMAITAISKSKRQLFNSRLRNRIEHLESIPGSAYARFADYNIVASVQPATLLRPMESQNHLDERLGSMRAKNAFAWKSLLKAHAHVAFGSHAPDQPLNPFFGIFSAVYRQNLNGKPARGWQPQQKISLEQALEAYSFGPAYATHEEHVKGTIREGKYADLVVLEQDVFRVRAQSLVKIPVFLTIVDGRIMYDNSVPQLREAPTGKPAAIAPEPIKPKPAPKTLPPTPNATPAAESTPSASAVQPAPGTEAAPR